MRQEPNDRGLVSVVGVAVAFEYMGAVVAHVTDLNARLVGQLVLNGDVPCIERGCNQLVWPDARRHVSSRTKQRKNTVGRNYWELVGSRPANRIARSWQTGSREVEGGSLVVVGGRVQLLVGQNRQVLRDRVSKQRSEHADVIAAPVTHADNRLWSYLVSNSQPRRELRPVVFGASVITDTAVASNPNYSFRQYCETAVALTVHAFRSVELPAQTVVKGQFRRDAPGVLAIEEIAILRFHCRRFGRRTDVAVERSHFAEQERGQI